MSSVTYLDVCELLLASPVLAGGFVVTQGLLSLPSGGLQSALAVTTLLLLGVTAVAWLLWRKNRQLTKLLASFAVPEDADQEDSPLTSQQAPTVVAAPTAEADETDGKYSHSSLSGDQRETLASRIQDALAKPEVFCQQGFTLSMLARMVESNTTYVSQVVNELYGVAFSHVIGRLRVQEACRRMDDTAHYGNFTIEGIAGSVGFKSRTTFVNLFKRETGMTPSDYQRQMPTEKC